MENYFITNLKIKTVRNIEINLDIPLSSEKRKHLLITGKNGSGKTSLLLEMERIFKKLLDGGFFHHQEIVNEEIQKIRGRKGGIIYMQPENYKEIQQRLEYSQYFISDFIKSLEINFSNTTELSQEITDGNFILALFKSQRENKPIVPNSIGNISISKKNTTETKDIHLQFIKFLVRLRNTMLNEQFDGNQEKAKKIQEWFSNFENTLKKLFDEPHLKLKYDNKNLNFQIEYENRSFALNQLSDGYSSILAILTELILRMEAHNVEIYNMQGVVLIDELETHLHIELQKKIFHFLVDIFPNIQFIITTHSPFILHSMSNSVICDLENKTIIEGERLVNSSYSKIVKNYFEVDSEFSKYILAKLERYEFLVSEFEKENLNENKEKELLDLDMEFDRISSMLSGEVYLRFKESQDRISE